MAPKRGGGSSTYGSGDDDYSGSSVNGCSASGAFESPTLIGSIVANVFLIIILIIIAFINFRVKMRNQEARKILRFAMNIVLLFTFIVLALDVLFTILSACLVASDEEVINSTTAAAVLGYLSDIIIAAIILLPLLTSLRKHAGAPPSITDKIRLGLVVLVAVFMIPSLVLYCYLIGTFNDDSVEAYNGLTVTYYVIYTLCAIVASVLLIGSFRGLEANGALSKSLKSWIVYLAALFIISSLYRLIWFAVYTYAPISLDIESFLATTVIRTLMELLVILGTIMVAGNITGASFPAHQPTQYPTNPAQVYPDGGPTYVPAPAPYQQQPMGQPPMGQQAQYPYPPVSPFQPQAVSPPSPQPPTQYYR